MFYFEQESVAYFLTIVFLIGSLCAGIVVIRRKRVLSMIPLFRSTCRSSASELVLALLLTLLSIVALAVVFGPRQKVLEKIPVKEGLTIVASIDCSLSMLAPVAKQLKNGEKQPTRFSLVTNTVHRLFETLPYDKKGFVCFAKDVYASKATTTDYLRVLKPQLDKLTWRYIATIGSGSNLAAGLIGCADLFDLRKNARNVCILFSDGEPQGAKEAHFQKELARAVEKIGAQIRFHDLKTSFYLVGVGDSSQTLKIPKFDGAGNFSGFVTDDEGKPVTTRPDERYLRDIAQVMKGTFVHIDNPTDMEHILQEIIANERKLIEYREVIVQKDASFKFTLIVFLGIVLLLFIPKRFIFWKKI